MNSTGLRALPQWGHMRNTSTGHGNVSNPCLPLYWNSYLHQLIERARAAAAGSLCFDLAPHLQGDWALNQPRWLSLCVLALLQAAVRGHMSREHQMLTWHTLEADLEAKQKALADMDKSKVGNNSAAAGAARTLRGQEA